jgi:hypothetical protein
MSPSISEAEFEALCRRNGLVLTAEQRRGIFEGYAYLEAMIARVNTPLPREAEPALIFTPVVGGGTR